MSPDCRVLNRITFLAPHLDDDFAQQGTFLRTEHAPIHIVGVDPSILCDEHVHLRANIAFDYRACELRWPGDDAADLHVDGEAVTGGGLRASIVLQPRVRWRFRVLLLVRLPSGWHCLVCGEGVSVVCVPVSVCSCLAALPQGLCYLVILVNPSFSYDLAMELPWEIF